MDNVKSIIHQLIEEVTNGAVSKDSIYETDHLRGKLGITSLQFVLLALKLEESFHAPVITSENITDIVYVGDLYSLVHQINM